MIFDLDGVIADTHPIHRQAWRQLLVERGQRVSEEELDFILEGSKREEILRRFLGSLPAGEMFQYGQRKDELFHQSVAGLRAIPGVVNLLQELDTAGIPMAVATSGSRGRANEVIGQLGLASCFTAVVTGDDTANGKPDPAIFCLAANCLQVARQQLLVAEDSRGGVRAAKSAGMKCLGIASDRLAFRLYREGADRVVPDFRGISLLDLQGLFEDSKPTNESLRDPSDGTSHDSQYNRP
jgi:HAD superfamily hydrolase (TIGR01509 family)